MTKKKFAHPKRAPKRTSEKPVDKEIRRAAKRAGITPTIPPPLPDGYDVARGQLVKTIGPRLVQATELCGETLATLIDCHTGLETNVAEINALLWRCRWDLLLAAKALNCEDDEQGSEVVS
jgi:hypothetical protein